MNLIKKLKEKFTKKQEMSLWLMNLRGTDKEETGFSFGKSQLDYEWAYSLDEAVAQFIEKNPNKDYRPTSWVIVSMEEVVTKLGLEN